MGEVLGEGGYSVVKSAISNIDGRRVAVKIITRKDLSEADDESLRQEVAILGKLRHPNITRLVDFFEEPEHYYVVLEYLDGGELFDRIVKKTYYSEKEARDLVFTVLKAIKFCHDQHIVHRDLKPENLLLASKSDDSDIKLADFGFATYAEGLTITSQCGTPGYIAPEILKSKPYGKLPVPVFSVVLCRCLQFSQPAETFRFLQSDNNVALPFHCFPTPAQASPRTCGPSA